jgi:methylated-DNA-protein-cysteine methyltransferase-like protein
VGGRRHGGPEEAAEDVGMSGRDTGGDFERSVAEVLAGTGPGDVMSYGEVAAEAGYPGAARAVGNILARTDGLPWWRVVTASGRLVPHAAAEQARLLAGEGVTCRHCRVVAVAGPADGPSRGR